jgi:hypothetical protein
MRQVISMCLVAVLVLAGALPSAAQYRGEEVLGKITQVSGGNIVVRRDNGAEVRINVTPSTEVFFQDSGDRKLFPNPTSADLKAGMGVKFVYNDGNPTRVTVVFVPASTGSGTATTLPAPLGATSQVKARLQAINQGGRQIQADVAGTTRTYAVESGAVSGRAVRRGQLVLLTLADRAGAQVVTRIDPADAVGTVVRVDDRSMVVDVDGRQETYSVENDDVVDDIRAGQRVRFEVEERSGGRRVVTAVRPE